MASSASPNRGNGNVLILHRLTGMDERIGRVVGRVSSLEDAVRNLKVAVGKIDTKMNILLGILGAIGSGASFLFIRLLLN